MIKHCSTNPGGGVSLYGLFLSSCLIAFGEVYKVIMNALLFNAFSFCSIMTDSYVYCKTYIFFEV